MYQANTQPVVWREIKDPESGESYYHNISTGETTWDRPYSFPFAAGSQPAPQPVSRIPVPNSMWEIITTDTGEEYYHNKETKETTWTRPEELVLLLQAEQAKELEKEQSNARKRKQEEPENPPSKKTKVEENPDEDAKQQFEQLLEEHNVNQFSFWEKVLPNIITDPRYQLVPSLKMRKQLFDNYATSSAKRAQEKKLQAQPIFKTFCDEAIKRNILDFVDFEREFSKRPGYSLLSDEERRFQFEKQTADARKEQERHEHEKRKRAKQDFSALLKEQHNIYYDSSWPSVQPSLRRDPRYRAVSSETREKLFDQYTMLLRKEYERDRKSGRSGRDSESQLLRQHVAEDAERNLFSLYNEFIKTPNVEWEQVEERLQDQPRFQTKELSRMKKKELFNVHLRNIRAQIVKDVKEMFRDHTEIVLDSPYDEVHVRFQHDARYKAVEDDKKVRKLYEEYQKDLLEEAKKNFQTLLVEAMKTITLSKFGPQFDSALNLLKTNPIWTTLDNYSSIRQDLIEQYQKAK